MYIFKNALRSISRSKGRNILVGIIVLVIAVSTCVALSIREAAAKAKESTLDSIQITAQISVDRQSMMKNATTTNGAPDRASMQAAFAGETGLSLDEMLVYAKAESVKAFTYTLTTSLNGSDAMKSIDTSSTSTTSSSSSTTAKNPSNTQQNPNGGQGNAGFARMGTQGDFTLIGYSSDSAMTAFVNGNSTITQGAIFDEGTSDKVCVISDELALYNSLSVGDVFTLVNPNNTAETIALTIVGIYNNSQATVTTGNKMGGFSAASDPANEIYMSYNALKAITTSSIANATAATSTTTSTALREQVAGTYMFADVESYHSFDAQARSLGLADTYIISSSDVTSYEQSLQPLENLSKFATYFLIVVLLIGGIILIVLNIFNIRERKYEIGVLTAIGMKKRMVSLQFISELFVVTFSCIIIGAGVGASVSVPITNSLLKSQVSSAQAAAESQVSSFGRSNTNSTAKPSTTTNGSVTNNGSATTNGANGRGGNNMGVSGGIVTTTTNYISEVSSATNFTVIMQLMGIGIILTLLSSCAAVIFVLRYEPLKILTNRD